MHAGYSGGKIPVLVTVHSLYLAVMMLIALSSDNGVS